MESPDEFVADADRGRTESLRPAQPLALLVGGTADELSDLQVRLRAQGLACVIAQSLRDAQDQIRQRRFDLLLLDPDLPDGSGYELARSAQRTSPHTRTIVFGRCGSFAAALEAMRCGAIDYVDITRDPDDLPDRVAAALDRSSQAKQREDRFRRLQQICTELYQARKDISEQVETLCSDLGAAYQDLTEHIDDVAIASEFRTLARLELDVEDLLRTTLEYLLAKIGPTNAAVFLPESGGVYNLGAYVNYDCPRESIDDLLDHLCDAICPQLADDPDLVSFEDAEQFSQWLGLERGFIDESHIVAFACRHESECLSVVVLFRHGSTPFRPEIAATLDTIRTIFAEQLARIINIHHRAKAEWPEDVHGEDDWDDEYGFGFDAGLAA